MRSDGGEAVMDIEKSGVGGRVKGAVEKNGGASMIVVCRLALFSMEAVDLRRTRNGGVVVVVGGGVGVT